MVDDGWEGVSPEAFRDRLARGDHLDERALAALLLKLREVLLNEDNLLELGTPINVVGDVHGQLLDVFKLFDELAAQVRDNGPFGRARYLFLGDYVDRGYQSIETFAYLAFLKVRFPSSVWLLRGNHESRQVNQTYGLYIDCTNLYGHAGTWYLMNDVFDCLPVGAVVDGRLFCVHGGLSPRVALIEQVFAVNRFKDIEDDSAVADLTWSDPEESATKFMPNRRGNGFMFGAEQCRVFLQNNKLGSNHGNEMNLQDARHGLVLRSHQLAMEGWAWFHRQMCAIVWSAPNYGYKSGNKASVLTVMDGGRSLTTVFSEDPRSSQKPGEPVLPYFV